MVHSWATRFFVSPQSSSTTNETAFDSVFVSIASYFKKTVDKLTNVFVDLLFNLYERHWCTVIDKLVHMPINLSFGNQEERQEKRLKETEDDVGGAADFLTDIVSDHTYKDLQKHFRGDGSFDDMNASAIIASTRMVLVMMVLIMITVVIVAVYSQTQGPDLGDMDSDSSIQSFRRNRRRDRALGIVAFGLGLSAISTVVIQYLILKTDMKVQDKYLKYRISSIIRNNLSTEVMTHVQLRNVSTKRSSVVDMNESSAYDTSRLYEMQIKKLLQLNNDIDKKNLELRARARKAIVNVYSVNNLNTKVKKASENIFFLYRILLPCVILLIALVLPLVFLTSDETHADHIVGWLRLRNLHEDFKGATQSGEGGKEKDEIHSWEEAAPWVRAATSKLISEEDSEHPLSAVLTKGLAIGASVVAGVALVVLVLLYRNIRIIYQKMPHKLNKAREGWGTLVQISKEMAGEGKGSSQVPTPGQISKSDRHAISNPSSRSGSYRSSEYTDKYRPEALTDRYGRTSRRP